MKALWERNDVYKDDKGQCWYLPLCRRLYGIAECERNPAECEHFDAYFNAEVQAEENDQ